MGDARRERFDRLVLPHLGAAWNLARWLVRDAHDAEDVLQDALLKALAHVDELRGVDGRPWLLAIVRRTCWALLRERRPAGWIDVDDLDDAQAGEVHAATADDRSDPEAATIRQAERALLNAAVAALPAVFREALILREFEELPYRDIARIVDVPIGTVMSRLSRARGLLMQSLGAIAHASSTSPHEPASSPTRPTP